MQSLPIIADTPALQPGMGFQSYAEALAAAITGGSPAQFTIGIYGSWGSGKSSLLKAIYDRLSEDDLVIPVLFDAWRYEKSEHIIVPLLHAIHRSVTGASTQPIRASLGRALLSIVSSLKFNLGVIQVDAGAAVAGLAANQQDALVELDAAYARPFEDMRLIGAALEERRIVVLIDDLDRCSPANVVALLEAINLVMDVPGFVFVLALDYEVLVQAVVARYPHTSGHVFIEKMVQVPFRVPRLSLSSGFLNDLIPDWQERQGLLPDGFDAIALDVCTLALDANPRQIKRFINTIYVLTRVSQEMNVSVDDDLLAAVVGMQLRWPGEYQDLAEAVFAGDADPASPLRSSDDVILQRYANRFFSGVVRADLIDMLQLTQTVSPQNERDYTPGRQPADETAAGLIRDVNRAKLEEVLSFARFEPSTFVGTHYLEGSRRVRAKFGKTVLRLEAKDINGTWKLAASFLLTRDYRLAEGILGNKVAINDLAVVADSGSDYDALAQWRARFEVPNPS